MKKITNLNTLNALIRDENMASKEYAMLARGKDVPASMKRTLIAMSKDEAHHMNRLMAFKKWLKGR